ncbi:hypothetical protein CYMTET_35507, partial [Cymbomonas tetramitiformis]
GQFENLVSTTVIIKPPTSSQAPTAAPSSGSDIPTASMDGSSEELLTSPSATAATPREVTPSQKTPKGNDAFRAQTDSISDPYAKLYAELPEPSNGGNSSHGLFSDLPAPKPFARNPASASSGSSWATGPLPQKSASEVHCTQTNKSEIENVHEISDEQSNRVDNEHRDDSDMFTTK